MDDKPISTPSGGYKFNEVNVSIAKIRNLELELFSALENRNGNDIGKIEKLAKLYASAKAKY